MLSILGRNVRLCDGISRREALRVGGLGFTGLALPDLFRARAGEPSRTANGTFGRAKACIVVFNYGGPSHLDLWDLKPDAPAEIRGEFKPAATNVPGVAISEHLPRLARLADRFAIVRSVTHNDNDHAIGAYLALTGYSHPKHLTLGIEPPATPQDMPSLGSVVAKLRPATRPVFPYVALGDLRHFGNNDSLGATAGCLGATYEPFTLPFETRTNRVVDTRSVTAVMADTTGTDLTGRRTLLEHMNRSARGLHTAAEARTLEDASRRAYELLSTSATREAFDVAREPQKVRDAYGSDPFARNCLLARRLVEAGVPLTTLYSVGNRDWDTHGGNFRDLKGTLAPQMDRGFSALLSDLDARGLLDETLVVWMGDMGRTPKVNRDAGRDHWSFCYSVVLAGAGIRGGRVYGSSDRAAAYPSTNPVSPADLAATIYHSLGIDPRGQMTDQQGRPIEVSRGTPIKPLWA
ncbi:DUF1501 domain-containing protein [Frigoriglobus tundricola]|uniref:Uncharacterized DUF1501 protein, type 1 n=1 Tax=Frigoriglobus tundricola TaxID=2774151 RepID=A0A6M5Z4C7_9BACT|nr:DUF1501 domain-containing protein [Frigoriglobus tundricola]QJX00322.1 Uncharacterized DUF1501 protein, type 1 [Frigoriglobus tundricola]